MESRNTENQSVDLDHLAETAATVAAEAKEADTAREQLEAAQADLFERVIKTARPALRAIGTRPLIAYSIKHHADVNYYGGIEEEERPPWRAVCLSAESFDPTEDAPRANEGSFEGEDLAVREDGILVELRYSGSWSRWQGSSWGWTAEVIEYANPAEAIGAGWTDIDSYIERLTEALDTAIGSRKKAVAANRARAEQLGAIVSLLNTKPKGGRA